MWRCMYGLWLCGWQSVILTIPDPSGTSKFTPQEHAYYLDYQNLKANYTENFLQKLANWCVFYGRFGRLCRAMLVDRRDGLMYKCSCKHRDYVNTLLATGL